MFSCKQFNVADDQCAMKIGTDAILLGAWVPLSSKVNKILDIGAGSGIITLMMAQRSIADTIDGLEIEPNAYQQAVENFENSKWKDRLFCYHASLAEFVDEMDESYDVIVSNPPFYTEDYQTVCNERNLARFQNSLPPNHLFTGAYRLLSENGVFAVIIPFLLENSIIDTAKKAGLYPDQLCRIKGNPASDYVRTMIAFKKMSNPTIRKNELIIEKKRHCYTDEYKQLTQDFYLKF